MSGLNWPPLSSNGVTVFCWKTICTELPTNSSYLGAWAIHPVLILCLKILFDIIPGVSQETSWTLTNISYMFGSFLMFHWVRGVPFEFNSGAYDNLNMWEQIDNGAQYTPAKKFLLSVPIVLFLLSTHYTHYDLTYFTINFLAVLGVVIPKLPYVSVSSNSKNRDLPCSRAIGLGLGCSQAHRKTGSMVDCMAFVRYMRLALPGDTPRAWKSRECI